MRGEVGQIDGIVDRIGRGKGDGNGWIGERFPVVVACVYGGSRRCRIRRVLLAPSFEAAAAGVDSTVGVIGGFGCWGWVPLVCAVC